MDLIKVAIADANTLLREGLKRILAGESDLLVVGEAADNVEIADVVERTRPDVLLRDLKIPKREAVPVLLELKQKNLPTKVLILSLFPDKENILDTAKAGASGYALKSLPAATLIQAIRRVHRGEIWVDRQLNCAETFVEFARHMSTSEADQPENEIANRLSKRELEILGLVARGLTNEEIRKRLFISLRTVKIHLNHIFNKLNVTNRTQAALLFVNAYPHEIPGESGWIAKDAERPASRLLERPAARLFPRPVSPTGRAAAP